MFEIFIKNLETNYVFFYYNQYYNVYSVARFIKYNDFLNFLEQKNFLKTIEPARNFPFVIGFGSGEKNNYYNVYAFRLIEISNPIKIKWNCESSINVLKKKINVDEIELYAIFSSKNDMKFIRDAKFESLYNRILNSREISDEIERDGIEIEQE